jgi:hypothetical protein
MSEMPETQLLAYLAGLRAAGASGDVLVVAGDPARPARPLPAGISGRWRPATTPARTAS